MKQDKSNIEIVVGQTFWLKVWYNNIAQNNVKHDGSLLRQTLTLSSLTTEALLLTNQLANYMYTNIIQIISLYSKA